MKFNATTPIQLYAKESSYVEGKGVTVGWQKIQTGADTFYCEWKGTFGDRVLTMTSLGVNDSATVRMFYNPVIYNKLKTVQVVIVKNADSQAVTNGVPNKANINTYELFGGVDNVQEENQFMEFKVRRYEGK